MSLFSVVETLFCGDAGSEGDGLILAVFFN